MDNYRMNILGKIGGFGVALAALTGCNSEPRAVITEPDGTKVRTLTNDPYKIVLSLHREDIMEGLEEFVLHATDSDGPYALEGTIYASHTGNPVRAVINDGTNTTGGIDWPFEVRHVGSGNINRGTYDLFTIELSDGYWFHNPVVYTIVADVSAGTSQPQTIEPTPDNGDGDPDNGNGDSLADLLIQVRTEFGDEDGEIIPDKTNLTTYDFTVVTSLPKELDDRYGGVQGFTLGVGDSCMYVEGNEPFREVDGDTVNYTVTGEIIRPGNCDAPGVFIDAIAEVAVPGGNVLVKDQILAKPE